MEINRLHRELQMYMNNIEPAVYFMSPNRWQITIVLRIVRNIQYLADSIDPDNLNVKDPHFRRTKELAKKALTAVADTLTTFPTR